MGIVQTSGKIRTSGSGDVSGTMPSNFTAGNTAISTGCRFEGLPTSLTINGTTATLDTSSSSGLSGVWIRRVSNLAGSSNAFTLDTPGTSDYNTFSVEEHDDIDLTSPLDEVGTATGTGTTVTISSAGATDTANERVIAIWDDETGDSNMNIAVTGGATSLWIENDSNTYQGGSGAYRDETTTGVKSMTWTRNSGQWRGCLATYRLTGGGPTEIPVGRSDETDTAFALTRTKSVGVGLSSETDTGLALAATKQIPVGLASETDTAFALALVKSATVGLASETDTAFALAFGSGQVVGLAEETDFAFALTATKSIPVGLAEENDTSLPIPPTKQVSVGQAEETDIGLGLTLTKQVVVGLAEETDTAFALAIAGTVEFEVGLAEETDTALALGFTVNYPTLSNPSHGGGGWSLSSRQEDKEFFDEIFKTAAATPVAEAPKAAEAIVRRLPDPSPERIAEVAASLAPKVESFVIASRLARMQNQLYRIAKERAEEEEAVIALLFG